MNGHQGAASKIEIRRYLLEESKLTPRKEKWIRHGITQLKLKPKISILMRTRNPRVDVMKHTIDSVHQQLYHNWELCICDDASKQHVWEYLATWKKKEKRIKTVKLEENSGAAAALNQTLPRVTGEFVAVLNQHDTLTKEALFEIVKSINEHPSADIVYSDEDCVTGENDHHDPFFKPDWSPELLRSTPYMGNLTAIRRTLVEKTGGFNEKFAHSPNYYLQLNASVDARQVLHVSRVLYGRRTSGTYLSKLMNRRKFRQIAHENLQQLKEFSAHKNLGTVDKITAGPNLFRLKYPLPDHSLVTIIIPTYDKLVHLKKCLRSVQRCGYSNIEVVIVTNNVDEESEMRAYLRRLPCKVVVVDEEFNWSRMNNVAVETASGEYLLFLNDDTEAVTTDWIENMLQHAQQSDVGAVGCRLLFPDEGCQHAGVTGDPLYVAYHQYYHRTGDGYRSMIVLPRDVSAVTGACMMVRKQVFQTVGGFDSNLRHLFGDTDFCWRLRKLGYRIIYDASTVLYHQEAASRTGRIDPSIVASDSILMLRRWRSNLLSGDQFFNYNIPNARIDSYGISRFFYPAPQKTGNEKSILLLTHNLIPGRPQLNLLKAAIQLRTKGYQLLVVSPKDGKLRPEYSQQRIPVMIVPDLNNLCSTGSGTLRIFMASFDVVIANTIMMHFVIPFIKELAFGERPRTIWIIHERKNPDTLCKDMGIRHDRLMAAFENTDTLVFGSEKARRHFHTYAHGNFVLIHDRRGWTKFQKLVQ